MRDEGQIMGGSAPMILVYEQGCKEKVQKKAELSAAVNQGRGLVSWFIGFC